MSTKWFVDVDMYVGVYVDMNVDADVYVCVYVDV